MATSTPVPRRLAHKGRAHAQPYERPRARRVRTTATSPSPSPSPAPSAGGFLQRFMGGIFPSNGKKEVTKEEESDGEKQPAEEIETSDEDRPEGDASDGAEAPFMHTRRAEAERHTRGDLTHDHILGDAHTHTHNEDREADATLDTSGEQSGEEAATTTHSPSTERRTAKAKAKATTKSTTKSSTKTLHIDKESGGPTQRQSHSQRQSQSHALVVKRGHRRSRSRSPSAESTEALLNVLKRHKSITLTEYERLTSQLRRLVEPSPENALALTRQTLNHALAPRPLTEYGQHPSTKRWRDEEDEKNSGKGRELTAPMKMPRLEDEPRRRMLPVAMSMPVPARRQRQARPSRLLTGGNRDPAARSAYSAAVAEKVLSRLNKVPSPLEQETQKPTAMPAASATLSWAKYQLAAMQNQTDIPATSTVKEAKEEGEDEDMPPRATLPTVPVHAKAPVAAKSKSSLFTFPTPTAVMSASLKTPAAKPKAGGMTLFTPPEVSMTPTVAMAAPVVTKKSVAVVLQATAPKRQNMGQYSFTLPAPAAVRVHRAAEHEIKPVYIFSAPSSQRQPPKRAAEPAPLPALNAGAPFKFVPASPKPRPESLTKSSTPTKKSPGPALRKESEKPRTLRAKIVEPSESSTTPALSGFNPLARFMTPAAGKWKCPTCSVLNNDDQAKCPCCDTDRPGSPAPPSSNPLARFATPAAGTWKCPTCAVLNKDEQAKCPCCDTDRPGSSKVSAPATKETVEQKPTAGSIGTGGFFYGGAKTTASTATSGFTFGADSSSTKTATEKSSKVTSDADAPKPGFFFGTAAKEAPQPAGTENESHPAPPAFKFEVTAGTTEKPKPETPAFLFGAPTAQAKPVVATSSVSAGSVELIPSQAPISEEKPATPAFSFGVLPSKKVENEPVSKNGESSSQSETEEKASPTKPISFGTPSAYTPSFGGSTGGFSFGLPPKPTQPSTSSAADSSEQSEKSDEKKTLAIPSFTFGAPSTISAAPSPALATDMSIDDDNKTPATAVATSTTAPAFKFTPPEKSVPFAAPAADTTETTPVSKPAFSFGSATTSPTKPAPIAEAPLAAKPSFTFGQSSASTKPSFTFGATTASSSTASASASAASAAPAADKPVATTFTFGSSTQPVSHVFGSTSTSSGTSFGQSTGFGATPATSTSTSFGASMSTSTAAFGSTTTEPTKPAFAFGGTPESAQPVQAAQTSFGFGNTSQASSGFGVQASNGFGTSNSSPAFGSTPFGSNPSTSGGFGLTAAPAFGTQPASAPAFGGASTAGSTGFGSTAPAPSVGFGSAASTTPSFNGVFGSSAASNAPAFGQASSAFGATAPSFQQAPSPVFGAPAQSPSPVFAAPVQSPSPVFGGPAQAPSPAFGAPPAPAFGAPNPAFGGPPPAGAFGGPASGGFNVGAAPSNGAKRRILRARPRRRQ